MAQALTLARPYARAAFATARAAGQIAEWSRGFAFATAAAADPQVVVLSGDPRVGAGELAELHRAPDAPADGAFARFLRVLADARRLDLMVEVAALYEELKLEADATLKVTVTSAMALDAAEQEQLRAALQRRFSRAIEMTIRQDPALLGGVIVDAGDEVIDGSARGRLERLTGALQH
ncbi:MAG: F0F1 ATP synthase subunit delta [Xanthomonadaceae bacterium]|nr:F0F1 ATP synthase subunit delta [Xanthomonadaceae bacterium]MDE2177954.1 F0F1 ATP synthase subunit delta [Xanthomonadaceae bacterium]MDE2246053.1 F0F1 ATP synthase subunit delta [Xanthomonadaceae bacterium]